MNKQNKLACTISLIVPNTPIVKLLVIPSSLTLTGGGEVEQANRDKTREREWDGVKSRHVRTNFQVNTGQTCVPATLRT